MFKNYSMSMAGILVSVVGTLLIQYGFSEGCATEITESIPLVIGGVMAWIGRVRKGDVTLAGFRK